MWRWTEAATPTGKLPAGPGGRCGFAGRSGFAPSSLRPRWRGESGFTLAAVVILMAVMAVMLTVAVQTVSFQKRRENEEELIFRGNQIVEAVRLFRSRHGRFPSSLVELARANPRVLRKIWSDPITGKPDWVPVFLGQEGTPVGGGPGGGAPPTPTRRPGATAGVPPRAFPRTDATGPVVGAHSRSCETSIKVFNGRTRYCDWKFVFNPQATPGGGGRPAPPPSRPGGGPIGPGRPRGGGSEPPITP